ncbi:hypothetical protein AJ79_04235 [Helicocarpus griseus UAMH5409]|uniref:BZIP domain-containing protein n=1 Tax=Helicocarpus griseus UAMH5409 TaxID=1447875 RepID=A0A2B7XUP7_9EURO|nr:hypothetical protein AJ79_04235 [Helicocarpus griseus UAMH5409]
MSKRPHASDYPSGSPSHRIRRTVAATESSSLGRSERTFETLEPQLSRDSGSTSLDRRAETTDQSSWRTPTTRSLEVHNILNPSHTLATGPPPQQGGRDVIGPTPSTSPSPSTNPQATPSPMGLTPQSDRSVLSQNDRSIYSPMPQRRILTAKSPAARTQSIGTVYPPIRGTMTVEQTPFVPLQSPYGEPPLRSSMEARSQLRYSLSHHSAPPSTFPSDSRPTVGQGPASQNVPQGRTHTTYSPFVQTSHAPVSTTLLQQPINSLPQPTSASFVGEEYRGGTPHEGGPIYNPLGGHSKFASPRDLQSRLSVPVDLESGSRKAAEKRLKNSDASKRFRERKKVNEKEMKQEMERQKDEIRYLTEERDFYRAERDFFRSLCRDMGLQRIPPRPASPRFRQSSAPVSESEGEQPLQEMLEREAPERHIRQRTSSAPTRLPLPQMSPAQLNPYPGSYQGPWSTSASTQPQYPAASVSQESSLPPLQPPR